MEIKLTEHTKLCVFKLLQEKEDPENVYEFELYRQIKPRTIKSKRNEQFPCYTLHYSEEQIEVQAGYYIGIDWLIPKRKYLYVAPKVNIFRNRAFQTATEQVNIHENPLIKDVKTDEYEESLQELNYLRMFLEATSHPEVASHIEGLILIDWESPQIEIEQREDMLSPFLVVQFLNLLKQIVRKGLKKSHYTVRNNLYNKIKGKILVGENIKINIQKNRVTQTRCEYQEFGIDNQENRFLKKVLYFASDYVSNNPALFKGTGEHIQQIIDYCRPAFETVSVDLNMQKPMHIKLNVFFKEYTNAINTGKLILKRFSHSISASSRSRVLTPPFWIDMPKLFELFVYQRLLEIFPNHVEYHFSTYGNELDFLITLPGYEMIIDAKYKLHYSTGHIHEDIRQLAGYARLNKVLNSLKIDGNRLVDCVIVYPDLKPGTPQSLDADGLRSEDRQIKAYRQMFKTGINLPLL